MNTNDNANVTPATPDTSTPDTSTPDTSTPATVPAVKPTRTRTRTRKPAASTGARLAPTPRTIRTMDDAVSAARHVTPANFDAMIARYRRSDVAFGGPSRNVGIVSGSRIMDLQNEFMRDHRGLNDLQILFVWRVDFPAAVGRVFVADAATGVGIVRGVRAEYNRNGHGSKTDTWRTVKSESFGPSRFEFPKPAASATA